MDARELRIGNYVFRENSKLINQKDDVYQIENINLQSAHKYDPIPLTEEWLLKFGFKRLDNDEYFSFGNIHYNFETKLIYIGNDHVSGGHDDAKINYVHQLQNLIFTLKGIDLINKN